MTKIDMPGIAPVRSGNGTAQAVCVAWNHNQVDVVRHQAIRPYSRSGRLARFAHELDVAKIVGRVKESLQATIAALRYVMRAVWYYNAGDPCHFAVSSKHIQAVNDESAPAAQEAKNVCTVTS